MIPCCQPQITATATHAHPASASPWPQVVKIWPQIAMMQACPASASQPQVGTIYKEVSTLTDVDNLKEKLANHRHL
jgi:hypothetical protein